MVMKIVTFSKLEICSKFNRWKPVCLVKTGPFSDSFTLSIKLKSFESSSSSSSLKVWSCSCGRFKFTLLTVSKKTKNKKNGGCFHPFGKISFLANLCRKSVSDRKKNVFLNNNYYRKDFSFEKSNIFIFWTITIHFFPQNERYLRYR